MPTAKPPNTAAPTWRETRVLEHVFTQLHLPKFQAIDSDSSTGTWVEQIDPPYRARASYFHQFGHVYNQLGTLPAELRMSIEPLHPLANVDLKHWLRSRLESFGVAKPTADYGLTALSRALLTAYNPVADLFGLAEAPKSHPDLFLFDPLGGFAFWNDGERIRNFWVGNQRDLAELWSAQAEVKSTLLRTHSDHFCLGKSLLTRLIGPYLKRRWPFVPDGAGIPTVLISSQRDLEALADDLRNACELAPAEVAVVFRGQTTEHTLPDRSPLVSRGICPYADIRDHSVVPSLYRHYDRFLNDPAQFRAFCSHLLDWGLHSDLLFGEPATYTTLEGVPYSPKAVPPGASNSMSFHMAGDKEGPRGFEDMGPYTVWQGTTADGKIFDRYMKRHRPGHDSVRRSLILQHYGSPTPFIDVTYDIRVAEWFAFNSVRVGNDGLTTSGQIDVRSGKPAIFAFLVLDGLAPLIATEHLVTPEEALRPHRQACAVLGGAGNLYRNAASRFIALKVKFTAGFRPEGLPTARHLFPGPDEDTMLKNLLDRYKPPEDLEKHFPVYWFPNAPTKPVASIGKRKRRR